MDGCKTLCVLQLTPKFEQKWYSTINSLNIITESKNFTNECLYSREFTALFTPCRINLKIQSLSDHFAMKRSTRFLESTDLSNKAQTQIKVCGITRLEDAIHATQCGAHALGFIFYSPSKRNMKSEGVRSILENMPESVSSIAVVVNPDDELLDEIVSTVRPDFIQFHGDESPARCRDSGIPFIKAFRVRNADQLERAGDEYHDASALLFDAFVPDKVGGTGMTFSWDLLPSLSIPVILAGGLHSGNVRQAIEHVKPDAVDVSTGVEFSPGIKNKNAISEFIATVQTADQSEDSIVA